MVLSGIIGFGSALALPCRAQVGDGSADGERAQFEAQSLLAQGRYKEACDRLEQSERSKAGPWIEWSLASCFERAGHAARAWELYRHIAEEPRASVEDAQLATARAAALEPRLAQLQIQVPHAAAVDGLRVMVDGVPLVAQRWGRGLRVDVGAHRVDVQAPGHRPWQSVVRLSAGAPPLRIEVPALEVAIGQVVTEAALPASIDPIDVHNSGIVDEPRWPQYTAAIIAGGIGVAGLTVGVIARGLSSSRSQDARKLCSRQPEDCPPSARDDRDALKRYAHNMHQVGDVALGVGAVGLLAGGVLFFLTQGKEPRKSPAVEVAPSLGLDRVGVSVSGSF